MLEKDKKESLHEKINEVCEAYLEYVKEEINQVKTQIENGETISSEKANSINDCIRTIHHIVSMIKDKPPIK